MEENNNNIQKTEWGYEIIWAKNNNYGGKILVFEKSDKTDFVFCKSTERSWFVNTGKFVFRWIDTQNGNIYQQEATDGFVFCAKPLVPFAIECVSNGGSLSEVNNGEQDNDTFIVFKKDAYK